MSSERSEAKTYRASRGVCWLSQGNGILIIDEVARRSYLLAYPEAAIWDMICRGHCVASIKAGLRWIMGDEFIPDSGIVRENLSRWVREGLLNPDISS